MIITFTKNEIHHPQTTILFSINVIFYETLSQFYSQLLQTENVCLIFQISVAVWYTAYTYSKSFKTIIILE